MKLQPQMSVISTRLHQILEKSLFCFSEVKARCSYFVSRAMFGKYRLLVLLLVGLLLGLVIVLIMRPQVLSTKWNVLAASVGCQDCPATSQMKDQRNTLSRLLNEMKQQLGQTECNMGKILNTRKCKTSLCLCIVCAGGDDYALITNTYKSEKKNRFLLLIIISVKKIE